MKKENLVAVNTQKNTATQESSRGVRLDVLFNAKKAVRQISGSLESAKQDVEQIEREILDQAEVIVNEAVGPFRIVEISVETLGGRVICGQGISKKSEYDSENPNLGYSIALGRAQKSLLQRINSNSTTRELFVG